MTAPRLPCRKSYSSCIDSTLVARRFTRGNQPHCLAPIRIDDHQDPAQRVQSYGDKPLFAFRLFVLTCDGMEIKQYGLGIGEGYTVLATVFDGFLGVRHYQEVDRVYIIWIFVSAWALFSAGA